MPQPTGSPPDFSDPANAIVTKTTSTTTKPTSAAPTPTTPLTRGPLKCFNEADFPGHADVQSGDQDTFSVDFSGVELGTVGPGDAPIKLRRTDRHGVNYDYRVEWLAGCVTTVDRQSFQFPLGIASAYTAYLLVREDYTNCTLDLPPPPQLNHYM